MKTQIKRAWIGALALLSLAVNGYGAEPADPGKEAQISIPPEDGRLSWFRSARFGMFIHWGLFSQGGAGDAASGVAEMTEFKPVRLPCRRVVPAGATTRRTL